ncbi:hypothetical protein [Candidatus Poriferisocius sp.]|uniref:vWA domain-containing protein n=1 Tax=Candidatus Poriferisocius sp. TaxID=3101276 RepID=UPI003B02D040
MRSANRVAYSRWDGTQTGFDLSASDLFARMNDDLLYHGDVNAALRRLLQQGFDVDGQRVQGLRNLLEQIREKRRERLEQHDLGGVYDDIAQELRDVMDAERDALDELAATAANSGDERRAAITEEDVAQRRFKLDMLPPDMAGQIRELENYQFTSAEAQQRFDDLVEQLRQQLLQSYVNQMTDGMNNLSPEDMARAKDMMAELNRLLEKRQMESEQLPADAHEPSERNRMLDERLQSDFDSFMERFGDFFPESPETLSEPLEVMARRMAAMASMMASMTPEQRAQLQGLAEQLLQDMDLRWQADQLSRNLQAMFPDAGWDNSYDFGGSDPLDFASAARMMQELGDLDQMDNLLRGVNNPGALAEVDIDRVRELVGDEAARSLEHMADMARMLEEAGLIENREGRMQLTPRAIRRIGQNALSDLFKKLQQDRVGRHSVEMFGAGHEREYHTKPYEFGDPFNLDIQRTIRNAIRRTGGGVPVRLSSDDFEVERTENIVRSATVLMLDLSLSMPMRDNFLPAKKVAMALYSLIGSQYPHDFLGIVGFSEIAREVKPEQLPEVSWDFVYGTNMQHGFMLARQMLAHHSGTKQIIMVTDGEPTAHVDEYGRPFFSYPPTRETVDRTLEQVMRATREGIRINTFMLDATSYLTSFIEQISRMNGGRAFFTTPETLGDYVLVDFVEHKRKLLSSRHR